MEIVQTAVLIRQEGGIGAQREIKARKQFEYHVNLIVVENG